MRPTATRFFLAIAHGLKGLFDPCFLFLLTVTRGLRQRETPYTALKETRGLSLTRLTRFSSLQECLWDHPCPNISAINCTWGEFTSITFFVLTAFSFLSHLYRHHYRGTSQFSQRLLVLLCDGFCVDGAIFWLSWWQYSNILEWGSDGRRRIGLLSWCRESYCSWTFWQLCP